MIRNKPPENPAMRGINAAAKRAQKHIFTGPGKSFDFHGTGGTRERLVGNELAEGHKKAQAEVALTPPAGRPGFSG